MSVAELEPETVLNTDSLDDARTPVAPQREPGKRRRPSRARKVIVLTGVAIAAVVWQLPWLVANSGMHNQFMPEVPGYSVMASRVDLGWFSPTVVYGLKIQEQTGKSKDKRGKAQQQSGDSIKAEKAEVKRSFLDMVRGTLKDAAITLNKPHFQFSLDDASGVAKAIPPIRTRVVDARITLIDKKTKRPLVDLPGVNFVASARLTKDGKILTIEPTKMLDHHKVSPDLLDKGLELVAPLLADSSKLSGSLSLEIKKCEIRFQGDDIHVQTLSGQVVMHEVRSSAEGTTADVVELLNTVFGTALPRQLQVVEDSAIDFEFKDGRVYHTGLAFLLPEVTSELMLTSSGSVGLDRTLDATLTINVPRKGFDRYPLMRQLAEQPLQLALTGTTESPALGLAKNQTIVDALAARLAPTPGGEPEPVPDAVLRLIRGVGQPRNGRPGESTGMTGSILNLIRSVQEQQRKNAPAEGVAPRPTPRRRAVPRRRINRRRFPRGMNPNRPMRPPLTSELDSQKG